MPDLYGLEFSGATHGSVDDFSFSHTFSVGLSGASSLTMSGMSVGDTDLSLSGASSITGSISVIGDMQLGLSGASSGTLEGVADDLVIDVSGASNADLSDLPVHDANVDLSGASQATINLDGRLDANLSGVSHLYYLGDPTLGDIDTSGGSTVSPK